MTKFVVCPTRLYGVHLLELTSKLSLLQSIYKKFYYKNWSSLQNIVSKFTSKSFVLFTEQILENFLK